MLAKGCWEGRVLSIACNSGEYGSPCSEIRERNDADAPKGGAVNHARAAGCFRKPRRQDAQKTERFLPAALAACGCPRMELRHGVLPVCGGLLLVLAVLELLDECLLKI